MQSKIIAILTGSEKEAIKKRIMPLAKGLSQVPMEMISQDDEAYRDIKENYYIPNKLYLN